MISTLIDRPAANRPVLTMPADRVGRGYPVHEVDERLRSPRFEHHVPVVGENGIGQQADRVSPETIVKHGEKGPVVRASHEEWGLPNAAVDDMYVGCGERVTSNSRHIVGMN